MDLQSHVWFLSSLQRFFKVYSIQANTHSAFLTKVVKLLVVTANHRRTHFWTHDGHQYCFFCRNLFWSSSCGEDNATHSPWRKQDQHSLVLFSSQFRKDSIHISHWFLIRTGTSLVNKLHKVKTLPLKLSHNTWTYSSPRCSDGSWLVLVHSLFKEPEPP